MRDQTSFKITCEGIGTHWWLDILDEVSISNQLIIKNTIINEIKNFETQYSRFKKDSLISQLSSNKFIPEQGSELAEMLNFAEKVRVLTGGYFDISVGYILTNLGYGNSNSIDLGGLGKGWLIDKLAKILKGYNLNNFTINGGGDIYTSGDKRLFYLENPLNDSEYIGSIVIQNSSIAASSGNKRRWKNNQQNINHHLINPKNKSSVSGISGVFTQAKSALYADVASTCLFVSPSQFLNQIIDFFEVEYLMVFPDASYTKSYRYSGELFY